MGGFAGGDEAGYWEEDQLFSQKKRVVQTSSHHFQQMLEQSNLTLVPSKSSSFTIDGIESSEVQSHKLYKAYKALCSYTGSLELEEFVREYKISILSESEADVAVFLHLLREEYTLLVSNEELEELIRAL
jgi:hypothetical protein